MKKRNTNRKKKLQGTLITAILIALYLILSTVYKEDITYKENVAAEESVTSRTGIEASNTEVHDLSESTDAEFHVEFIDVGQGDSILIYDNSDNACLIDTGASHAYDAVKQALADAGIKDIEYLVLSHPDADHIGNADEVLTDYKVKEILDTNISSDSETYQYYLEALNKTGTPRIVATAGNQYMLGDAEMEILAPEDENDFSDTNSHSIILKFVYKENSILFTGDATGEETEVMLASGADVSADIYKAAHHGSSKEGANSAIFLSAVNPSFAIISCGKDNPYKHPHKGTMDLLQEMKISMFRTDKQGTIIADLDGKHITWNLEPSMDYKSGAE